EESQPGSLAVLSVLGWYPACPVTSCKSGTTSAAPARSSDCLLEAVAGQRLVATTSATVADTGDTGRAHVRRVGARTAHRARAEVRRAPSAPRKSSQKSGVATRYRTRQEAVCGDGFGRSA